MPWETMLHMELFGMEVEARCGQGIFGLCGVGRRTSFWRHLIAGICVDTFPTQERAREKTTTGPLSLVPLLVAQEIELSAAHGLPCGR